MHTAHFVLLLALFSGTVHAQQRLPNFPTPKSRAPFMDRQAKIAAAATGALLVLDSAQTCHNLDNGGRELQLGTQRCSLAVAELTANKAIFWSAAYWAHRHHHQKIARLFEWAAPAWSAEGIIRSWKNGAY